MTEVATRVQSDATLHVLSFISTQFFQLKQISVGLGFYPTGDVRSGGPGGSPLENSADDVMKRASVSSHS